MSEKFFGGISLVTGTSIGAAALALPVVASSLGVLGTFFCFLLCWAVMYFAGLMVLEVSVACGSEKSFISMAQQTLGDSYKWLITFLYLILLYSLLGAYFSGGADLVHSFFRLFKYDNSISYFIEILPFVLVTSLVMCAGKRSLDYLNRAMVIGILVTFFMLLISLLRFVDFENIRYNLDLGSIGTLKLLPVIITAFGYQVVIPSLRNYLADDVKVLPKVILIGSLIPFFLYLFWSILIYLLLPLSGDFSITSLKAGLSPIDDLPYYLNHIYKSKIMTNCLNLFSFFALSSSVLGIAVSLFDFLADRLMYGYLKFTRMAIIFLTLFPPFIFTLFYPQGFIFALSFAGFFVAILNGIIPVMMFYKHRIKNDIAISYTEYGSMLLVTLVSLAILLAMLL
ncbi:MAG: aromatic amino acid transport family protein [Pseudomonadota bacterium]|nr:aromatic amino acid transport family protein [Pseudomonadota bacterium]